MKSRQEEKPLMLVGMSGGVDSSVCALLMLEAGYRVIGVTLHLHKALPKGKTKKGLCCTGEDVLLAKKVCSSLGIPHYVLDDSYDFQHQVIHPFADAYVSGKTPSPCVLCNEKVKFPHLINLAYQLGAIGVATGHYVRLERDQQGIPYLLKAYDKERDQSYFLFSLKREWLPMLHFPLGKYTKKKVRALASQKGLIVANKADSQDLCFVAHQGGYSKVIKNIHPKSGKKGTIRELHTRRIIKTHSGIENFTIGQRRGLGISGKKPYYVTEIDAKRGIVHISHHREDFKMTGVCLTNINWLGQHQKNPVRVYVRLRSSSIPIEGIFDPQEHVVSLTKKHDRIAPGQACVFYEFDYQDKLLGGGWITSTIKDAHNINDTRIA